MTATVDETAYALENFNAAAALALVNELGAKAGLVSLDIANPTALTRASWELIGKQICQVGESWQWWVGDWLNFGEGVFGEDDAAAAVDDKSTRYDVARRVTGMDQGSLQNIRWVCASVAKGRRRPELRFTHHHEVAKLEPDDQERWLATAIEQELSTKELRASIKEEKRAALGETPDPDPPDEAPSAYERLFTVCRELWGLAQKNPDGTWSVPNECMTKLVSELGDE